MIFNLPEPWLITALRIAYSASVNGELSLSSLFVTGFLGLLY